MSSESSPQHSIRVRRVEEAVREVIANRILKGLSGVPRGPVSVTRTEATTDLSAVKVFFSIFPGINADEEGIELALRESANELQRDVARQLRLKLTPKLAFIRDTGLDKQIRLTGIMSDLERQRKSQA